MPKIRTAKTAGCSARRFENSRIASLTRAISSGDILPERSRAKTIATGRGAPSIFSTLKDAIGRSMPSSNNLKSSFFKLRTSRPFESVTVTSIGTRSVSTLITSCGSLSLGSTRRGRSFWVASSWAWAREGTIAIKKNARAGKQTCRGHRDRIKADDMIKANYTLPTIAHAKCSAGNGACCLGLPTVRQEDPLIATRFPKVITIGVEETNELKEIDLRIDFGTSRWFSLSGAGQE